MQLRKLPEQISAVETSAFMNCTGISVYELPNVSCIGSGTFCGCTNLSSFKFNDANLSIGQIAFDRTALQEASLPSTMTQVGYYSFTHCSSLLSASGSEVLSIGRWAFVYCPELSALDMPKLKFLDVGAFTNVGFKDFDLSTIETVADRPFSQCKKLETVNLPYCLSAGGGYYGDCLFDGWWNRKYEEFAKLHTIRLPRLVHLESGVASYLSVLSCVDLHSL